ncbi:insoluble matrix shell protein 5 [Ruditapes philippinarum]|uniref:insoluble matrix shell protein 5 n=1 Tax=Ruditapes philippinarum TaxID=129788 RepID=UPI00295B6332|nr:insoluble matrix shell protein 5 [Ruditapes philippinarum]
MISVVTLACLIAVVCCQCPTTDQGQISKVFKAYDIDGNNKISRVEGTMVFRDADLNRDGALDNNEFSSEWAFYHNDYYSPFFNVADRNHNGRIEFVEGNQGFDHFDKNGDNEISSWEFTQTWMETVRPSSRPIDF